MKRSLFSTLTAFIFTLSSASAQMQWTTDTLLFTGYNTSGIAITPDNSKLVVTLKGSGLVKIINTSNFAISTVNVSAYDNFPDAVAIAPSGTLALVCATDKVIFIDLTSATVIGSFTVPCASTTLYDIAISPSGGNAYFPDLATNCVQQGLRNISAVAPSGSSTFSLINTGGQLYAIELSPDGAKALITGFTSGGTPRIYDISSGNVQTISALPNSYGAAALHLSQEALVFDGDSVVRVSFATASVIKKITSMTYNTTLQSLYVTPDDKYAFVMGYFEKKVIDLTTNKVLQTFGSGGTNVAARSDGTRFYVTEYSNGNVRAYHPVQGTASSIDIRNSNAFSVYPLPATSEVTFHLKDPAGSGGVLVILDGSGRAVMSAPVSGTKTTLDLSGLEPGLYFYRYGNAHGRLVRE
jgi:DNA-binding beta-propeller fold protein YncE